MSDPIIQELFPEKKSIHHNIRFDSTALANPAPFLGEDYTFPEFLTNVTHTDHDYLKGNFNLTGMVAHYQESGFPSLFARKNLLYMQLLCSCSFQNNHFTKRFGLNSYLLAQTFSGGGLLKYKGDEYELNAGDVFLISCAEHHEYHASDDGWGYRFLHFNGEAMSGLYQQFDLNHAVKFSMADNDEFQNAFKQLFLTCAAHRPEQEILTNRILTDMLTELLCALPCFKEKEFPDFIAKQCAYLQNHYNEKLTLDQLSKEFQVSKYHMSREFKKYTGYSIYTYIIECRINSAKRLLRYSTLPVLEISNMVGFEDHNNFYRAFEKKEEMSPSKYRKYWSTL